MNDSAPDGTSRGLRSDRFSGLLLLIVALVVAWENRVFPLGSMAAPGPGFVPLLLAVVLGAFGLLIAARGTGSPLLGSLNWTESKRGLVLLVACSVAVLVLERMGYRLTIIVLLVFMLGVVERKRALPTALVSVGFSLASYFVFATLLKVQLPRGPWGF